MSIRSVQRFDLKYPKKLLSSNMWARSPMVGGRGLATSSSQSYPQPLRRTFFDASGTRVQSIGVDADEAGMRRRFTIVCSSAWVNECWAKGVIRGSSSYEVWSCDS